MELTLNPSKVCSRHSATVIPELPVRPRLQYRQVIRMALVGFEVRGGFASRTQSSCHQRGLAVERSDNLSKLQISGWDPGVAGFAVERAIGLGS